MLIVYVDGLIFTERDTDSILCAPLFAANKIMQWISFVRRGVESIKECTVCREQDNTV